MKTNDKAYIFFSAHVLVAASHTPPALAQSAAVFAVFTSWAKEGPAKASARAIANMEIRVFMSFLPYAVLNVKPAFAGLGSEEQPNLSRVEMVPVGPIHHPVSAVDPAEGNPAERPLRWPGFFASSTTKPTSQKERTPTEADALS